jgi:phosphopentomutase
VKKTKPFSGKDTRMGHRQILSVLRETRSRKPLEDKHFKFGKFMMAIVVREAGSIISGKDTKSGHPPLILSC